MISLRIAILVAVLTTALVAFGCGDNDGGLEAPAGTSPATTSQTVSPTPARTAVAADDERLQEMLAQPGLVAFLSDLQDAIEANDVQFVIDNTHFAEYQCQSLSGFPADPEECHGAPGLTLPAVTVGAWQSEGGYWSEATYAAAIRDALSGTDADDARMYAIGQMTLGDAESPDVADVIVAGLGGLANQDVPEGFAMSLAVAERDGEWAITEFNWAKTELIPDFYGWWVAWEDFTSVAGA